MNECAAAVGALAARAVCAVCQRERTNQRGEARGLGQRAGTATATATVAVSVAVIATASVPVNSDGAGDSGGGALRGPLTVAARRSRRHCAIQQNQLICGHSPRFLAQFHSSTRTDRRLITVAVAAGLLRLGDCSAARLHCHAKPAETNRCEWYRVVRADWRWRWTVRVDAAAAGRDGDPIHGHTDSEWRGAGCRGGG